MGLDTRFVIEQTHASLLFDASNNPHPLTNPSVASPASISAMFSTISYNKGACIIRMTEHLLGHEVHRRGLQNYLKNRCVCFIINFEVFLLGVIYIFLFSVKSTKRQQKSTSYYNKVLTQLSCNRIRILNLKI